MSAPYFQPAPQEPLRAEWAARLIPGVAGAGKKKSQRALLGGAVPRDARAFSPVPPTLSIASAIFTGVASRSTRNVLIVGWGTVAQRIAGYLEHHPELRRLMCGFVCDRDSNTRGVLGSTKDLVHLARVAFIDEIILAPPYDRELVLRVLRTARQLHLDVRIAPELYECAPGQKTELIAGIPIISLHEERLPVAALWAKRALDVTVASASIVLLAPIMAALSLLIKLDSRGPAFYSALRAGRKGRPFRCFKFRTMVENADDLKAKLRECNQREGPIFKIASDPRITRIGRFLRRYSLDELPQLWNVLRGEMSLVGPRPHPLDDFSAYSIEHLSRLDVTPGLTGLWQISARRSPSFQAAMDLDIEYIHRWSLGMDLRILLKTATAVLRGSGE
jgi:exopolysaccharide biosynthesis polyprenyl glycosylphosphotransferase